MPKTFRQFEDKVVLITGATRGIGLCTALTYAELGASCIVTYHFGSEDEDEVINKFKAIGKRLPMIIQADVSNQGDTENLMKIINKKYSKIDIFINNVTLTSTVTEPEQYRFKDLKRSMAYSTWPLCGYLKQMKTQFGHYPRYVVAISTTGNYQYYFGYDFVAATKAAMECLCRYLVYRLRDEEININIIRTRAIKTWSLEKTFGSEFIKFSKHYMEEIHWIKPEEIANASVALTSGWLDAMNGQILTVDRGTSFFDNLMHFYTHRERFGLIFDDK